MTCETDHLFHTGILPDDYLILAVAMRADDLVAILAPCEVADLRASVDFLDQGTGGGVPEFDGAVCGATAGGEEVVLVRRPGDGVDGCNMGVDAV